MAVDNGCLPSADSSRLPNKCQIITFLLQWINARILHDWVDFRKQRRALKRAQQNFCGECLAYTILTIFNILFLVRRPKSSSIASYLIVTGAMTFVATPVSLCNQTQYD